MSDERQQRIIDLLYDELDPRQSREVRQAMTDDETLAAEFQSFAAVRTLYQQDELPEAPELLTLAILRQESILRQQPQTWWSKVFQWTMQPAVGIAAVVVVAVGLGVVGNVTFLGKQEAPKSAFVAVSGAESPAEAQTEVTEAPRPSIAEGTIVGDVDGTKTDGLVALSGSETDDQRTDEVATAKGARRSTVSPDQQRLRIAATGKAQTAKAKKVNRATSSLERPEAEQHQMGALAANKETAKRDEPSAKPARSAAPLFNYRADDKAADYLARDDKLEADKDTERIGATESKSPSAGRQAFAGSGGQLTEPGSLGDAFPGAGGNVGLASEIRQEEDSMETSSQTRTLDVDDADQKQAPAVAPPALAEEKARKKNEQSRALPHDRESFDLQQKQYVDRLQSSFAAGMRAYNYANYNDALSYFQRTYELDISRQLAPMPQIMQARTLVQLKRYQLAARFYEQVLNEFPKYEQRVTLVKELMLCQQMRKDNAALAQVKKRYAREVSVIEESDRAEAAAADPVAPAKPAAQPAVDVRK